MRNFFRNLLEWVTNPKKKIDRTIMGSILSQFVLLLSIFLLVFGFWLTVSYFGFKQEAHQINKEIPSRPWSILAQMVDPGNQHMIGKVNPENDRETFTFTTSIVNSKSKLGADTITLKKAPTAATEKDSSRSFWFRLMVFLMSISGTVIFTGLLVSTITNIFERRVEKINAGLRNYNFKNHRVIIGFDYPAIGLIKQILNDKSFTGEIVLHTQQQISETKEKIYSHITVKQRSRFVFMFGSRTKEEEILRLSTEKADKIYILGEPEGFEYDCDSKNVKCYNLIDNVLVIKKSAKKDCYILFENPTTFTAFQFADISGKNRVALMHSFNFHESWAQKVFALSKLNPVDTVSATINYKPLDHKSIDVDSDCFVHLVVIGMTRMGRAMAIEAARLGHYANFEKKKTRITFIDMDAERHEQFFRNCYESFYNAVDINRLNTTTGKSSQQIGQLPFINIELEFITGAVESEAIRNLISNWSLDSNQILTIAVCFNYAPFSLSTAMYLPKVVFDNEVPILVRQESEYVLTTMLIGNDSKSICKYRNLKPFGSNTEFIDNELLEDWKAKRVSYYYSNLFKPLDAVDFNNNIEIENSWVSEEEKNKWANRYIVQSFTTKYRAINKNIQHENRLFILSEDEIDLLARMEHARWNVERLLAGYSPTSQDIIIESMKTSEIAFQYFIANGCNEKDEEFKSLKAIHKNVIELSKAEMKHSCIIPYQNLSNYYKFFDRNLMIVMPKIINMYIKHKIYK